MRRHVAFTGGLNIADEWVAPEDGGGGWHDAAVRVEGPAVAVLEEVFLRTWNRRARKRARLAPEKLVRPAAAGDTRLAVVSNKELLDRFAIRRAALYAIRESRASVFLANPYFVPDRGILRALQEAARARRRRPPARAARTATRASSTSRRARRSGRCWPRACASG